MDGYTPARAGRVFKLLVARRQRIVGQPPVSLS